ncbi:MAG: ABC transporter permease subunit [Actinomycetota bacterium]
MTLGLGAACLWLVTGIPIGILAAVRRRGFWARASMPLRRSSVCSLPVFWLGQLLLYVFWFKLNLFPASGLAIGQSMWQAVLEGRFILRGSRWRWVHGVLRADGARQHDRDVVRGLHADGARQGAVQAA